MNCIYFAPYWNNKSFLFSCAAYRIMTSLKYKFPFEIKPLEAEINAELLEYFHGERDGFVQVGPKKYFFPSKYKTEAEAYYNFKARPDDVWIATFPRSGTTWTQELIWLVANNLNFDYAKEHLLSERFPFFEFPLFMHPAVQAELLLENANDKETCDFIKRISRPGYESLSEIPTHCRRFIKTHFPFSLLPPSVMAQKCKLIYVSRNPQDVAVSFYHLNRLYRTQGYVGDFERYWRYFEQGLNPWLPYFSHLKEGIENRHLSNVLFLRYEDMLRDLKGVIYKVANFLDCQLDAVGVEKLVDHLNIKNFRTNPAVNGREMADVGVLKKGEADFVRTGGTAQPKELTDNPRLLMRANYWVAENERKVYPSPSFCGI